MGCRPADVHGLITGAGLTNNTDRLCYLTGCVIWQAVLIWALSAAGRPTLCFPKHWSSALKRGGLVSCHLLHQSAAQTPGSLYMIISLSHIRRVISKIACRHSPPPSPSTFIAILHLSRRCPQTFAHLHITWLPHSIAQGPSSRLPAPICLAQFSNCRVKIKNFLLKQSLHLNVSLIMWARNTQKYRL